MHRLTDAIACYYPVGFEFNHRIRMAGTRF